MDFLRNGGHRRTSADIGGQSADNRDFTVYIIRCVSRRIDTWQIVYLSYKDPCPTIYIHKSEMKVH